MAEDLLGMRDPRGAIALGLEEGVRKALPLHFSPTPSHK